MRVSRVSRVSRVRRRDVRRYAALAMVATGIAILTAALWGLVLALHAEPSVTVDIGTAHHVVLDPRGNAVHYIDGERIEEDDPRWNCATMGNLICGK